MKEITTNKKAYFDYQILEKYICGIVLTGTEMKPLRNNKISISESFCIFEKDELYIKNSYISKYDLGSYNNHEERRNRKLLLKKNELKKINIKVKEKGYTLIPLKFFFNDKNKVKVEIGLCKGKKSFDKRQSIKEKDLKRTNEFRNKNEYNRE